MTKKLKVSEKIRNLFHGTTGAHRRRRRHVIDAIECPECLAQGHDRGRQGIACYFSEGDHFHWERLDAFEEKFGPDYDYVNMQDNAFRKELLSEIKDEFVEELKKEGYIEP